MKTVVRVIVRRGDRVAAVCSKKWGLVRLPGGKVDPGETPEEAAFREVWEETGLAVEGLAFLGEGRALDTRVLVYRANDVPATTVLRGNAREGVAGWALPEEVLRNRVTSGPSGWNGGRRERQLQTVVGGREVARGRARGGA